MTTAQSDPPLARFVGRRPSIGVADAAKQVAEDASLLVRAELQAAKAEVEGALKAKAQGAGLFAVAGVLGWLALNGVLLTIGFALALVLPGWAAALAVTVLLLAGAAVAALIGRKRLAAQVSLERTKRNVAADVAVAKTVIPNRNGANGAGMAEDAR